MSTPILAPQRRDDDAAPTRRLPLALMPEGLVARAMTRIADEAEAGRARAVRPPEFRSVVIAPAPVRRPSFALPFLPAVLGLVIVAVLAAGGFAATWLWRGQDPVQQAELLLTLRQWSLDMRMVLRLEPVPAAIAALILSCLGLSAATLADSGSAVLRPMGRQA